MKTPLQLSKAVLNDGVVRHCTVWDFPDSPQLRTESNPVVREALRRRNRHGIRLGRPRINISLLLHALRKSR